MCQGPEPANMNLKVLSETKDPRVWEWIALDGIRGHLSQSFSVALGSALGYMLPVSGLAILSHLPMLNFDAMCPENAPRIPLQASKASSEPISNCVLCLSKSSKSAESSSCTWNHRQVVEYLIWRWARRKKTRAFPVVNPGSPRLVNTIVFFSLGVISFPVVAPLTIGLGRGRIWVG